MMHNPDPQVQPQPAIVLNPSARLLWRTAGQIQLELGTRRVIVDGIDQAAVRRLIARRGDEAALPASALQALAVAGFVARPPRHDTATKVPRLAAELAALHVQHGERANDVLAGRRAATVTVVGASRVAALVAALLAGAGVGHVAVSGSGDVRLHQAAPGGVQPGDEGRRFTAAATAAVTRAAPECDASPRPLHLRPDLVVLATEAPVDTGLRETLHALGTAHLVAQAGADHGAVGPLTLPGVASCLRCADLQRLDRDHAWSALAVQLAIAPKYGAPSDVSLATLVAGVAALQALAFLDGSDPATIEGTLEIQLPDWRLRRRSWPPHPDCDCGAHVAQSAGWAQ
ncbi:MAG TPA: thiamine biosynthesis protein ThiF [Methylomirabilota bacterium]|nr:thiamine biosynthesis protein ThiF [Methylomirabilota bacterium]